MAEDKKYTKPFTLPSMQARKEEFSQYISKEVGLHFKDGLFYGIPSSEDSQYITLNPHIAYNPLPSATGGRIQNAELRDSPLKVPKNILSGLVHEYKKGYLEDLVKATEAMDKATQNN